MAMYDLMFEYLKPTDAQIETMTKARGACRNFMKSMDELIPDGPDKTYLLRKFREVAMWTNIAITRNPDGSPRT